MELKCRWYHCEDVSSNEHQQIDKILVASSPMILIRGKFDPLKSNSLMQFYC